MDKTLGLLGIARRGGLIELGEDAVSGACRDNHARLVIVASDAGDSVSHRAEYLTRGGKIPMMRVDYDKATLGGAVGRNVCPIAALTDVRLALAVVETMPTPPAAIVETLSRGAERVAKRRREEKAHARNLRRGK